MILENIYLKISCSLSMNLMKEEGDEVQSITGSMEFPWPPTQQKHFSIFFLFLHSIKKKIGVEKDKLDQESLYKI